MSKEIHKTQLFVCNKCGHAFEAKFTVPGTAAVLVRCPECGMVNSCHFWNADARNVNNVPLPSENGIDENSQ